MGQDRVVYNINHGEHWLTQKMQRAVIQERWVAKQRGHIKSSPQIPHSIDTCVSQSGLVYNFFLLFLKQESKS